MDWATQGQKKNITRKYARTVGEKELTTEITFKCKHCASPISHSEFGIKNQMCDLCIAELVADQYAYENE